jgi:hypothetical protein
VTPPQVSSLRLIGPTPKGPLPRPPLGLANWSATADAIAVLLDAADGGDLRTIEGVAAQLPHASTLPSGTPLFVLGTAAAVRSFWHPFARGAPIPRASRCTALLARGYVDIGAQEVDGDDLSWGHAPYSAPSAALLSSSSVGPAEDVEKM